MSDLPIIDVGDSGQPVQPGQPVQRLYGSTEPVPGKCGSLLSNWERKFGHRRYCTRPAVRGRTRCRIHGGRTKFGPASGTYKHGGDSRFLFGARLPRKQSQTFAAFLGNPDLWKLTQHAALLDQRILNALDEIRGKKAAHYGRLMKAIEKFELAKARKNAGEMTLAFDDIKASAEAGLGVERLWDKILQAIDVRRKVNDTEQKRLLRGMHVLTADRAMLLVQTLSESVKRHVKDQPALQAIAGDLEQAMQRHLTAGMEDV